MKRQLTTKISIPQMSIQVNRQPLASHFLAWLRPMSYDEKLSRSLAHGYNAVRW